MFAPSRRDGYIASTQSSSRGVFTIVVPAEVSFKDRVKKLLATVPTGKVVTYGTLAAYAGSPRAARQVVWILNTYAEKEKLPWHRVINARGKISLGRGQGYELQREMLRSEGIEFGTDDTIDLKRYLWSPGRRE